AQSAFGDGALMLERLVERGRHIEIQVFADAHGNAIHLGERDCSTQRRRQKLIEEAPVLDAARRTSMGADAVAAARAVGYRGAGTVEFIVDQASGEHFFLEMNTRLQVEHPVTELLTGQDLVEWQLRIAAGEPLPLRQEQIAFTGHAIEARLCTEDAYDGFRPQAGRVQQWRPGRAGCRVDHGLTEGDEIGSWYDSMVAKIIVLGRDREDAIRRLMAALEAAPLLGVMHNGGYLRELLAHPEFRQGRLHTARLDELALPRPLPADEDWLVAAAMRVLGEGESAGPRPVGLARYGLTLRHGGEQRRWLAGAQGRRVMLDDHVVEFLDGEGDARVSVDGVQQQLIALRIGRSVHLARRGHPFVFEEPSPLPAAVTQADPGVARAPVSGLVAQVLVQPGDAVAEGQPLLSVEAMKMEMWLSAGAAGRVRAVHAQARQAVAAGAVLVELEILR
uniref:ATP-binding protein n=1 Tax=Pelomonas sp. KK5 TaxID=1855730 RepID=UPI00097BD626